MRRSYCTYVDWLMLILKNSEMPSLVGLVMAMNRSASLTVGLPKPAFYVVVRETLSRLSSMNVVHQITKRSRLDLQYQMFALL